MTVTNLRTQVRDEVLVAYFRDVRIVDESKIESLGQDLMTLAADTNNDKLIINFQNVSFMSSSMLGKLILFGKKCKTSNIKLRLCGINQNIQQVFDLMKLDKIFDIDADEETAFKKISKKGGWFG